jgi:hypothetical protein
MMDHDAEIEKATAQVVEDIKRLRQRIAEAEVPDDQEWFRSFLVGILTCALTDYRSVEIGVTKLIELAAWGRRNLLELKVTTEYILRSEENAVELRNDLSLDAIEFWESISKSHQAMHKQCLNLLSELANQEQGPIQAKLEEELQRDSELGPQTAESDAEAEGFREFLVSIGLKDGATPTRSTKIAKLLGPDQKEDFDPLFKICSKLMHRTILSIASNTVKGSLDAIAPFLKDSAAIDLRLIYAQINRYVTTTGIRLPPKRTP